MNKMGISALMMNVTNPDDESESKDNFFVFFCVFFSDSTYFIACPTILVNSRSSGTHKITNIKNISNSVEGTKDNKPESRLYALFDLLVAHDQTTLFIPRDKHDLFICPHIELQPIHFRKTSTGNKGSTPTLFKQVSTCERLMTGLLCSST